MQVPVWTLTWPPRDMDCLAAKLRECLHPLIAGGDQHRGEGRQYPGKSDRGGGPDCIKACVKYLG